MSVKQNLMLRTTYTQQIQYLGEEIEHLKSIISGIVQMSSILHQSHVNLCKFVYKDWFAVCQDCHKEHEKNKHVEKCEQCGGEKIGYSFPNPFGPTAEEEEKALEAELSAKD